MSKINSLRIINLNYNNNTMKIDDETFDLGGESTLMSLRNGGGKSVMVQMMIAPFVTKRYRNMKDREFNSYFTTNSPTYILTEWILDDEKTNVVIGMMIKRKTSSIDEDDDEEIDIVNFIHEYQGDSKYSIRNIPVVEINEKSKSIKSFGNSKNLFEKLKKDMDINFNYYMMNIPNQSRNYFEALKQYKINNKEWESIIKEINKKESGLSDLFSDSKTVAGLVEKWFIKVVGDKLNENKDKVKNFQDIAKKYVYQYKENKHKLNQKEAIEKFQILTKNILEKAYEFKNTKDNIKEIENKIANLIKYLEELLIKENQKIEDLDKEIDTINYYIKDLEYEKLSFQIHKVEDEYKGILYSEKNIQDEIEELEVNIKKATRRKNIMDCALKYENYQKSSKDVQESENKIQILKDKDIDSKPERENLGFTLKNYYINIENKLNNDLNVNLESEKENSDLLKAIQNNVKEINEKLYSKNRNKGIIEEKINSFSNEEKRFNKRYNKNFNRNIVGFYEENFIEKIKINYNENSRVLQKNDENYKLEKIKLEDNTEQYQRNEKELIISLSKLELEKEKLEEKFKITTNNLEKRKDIVKYIDSDESYIFDDTYIVNSLENKKNILNEENNHLNIKKEKIDNEINKLISGKTIELSKEVKEKLHKKDIHIVYGMQWLKENNYSEEENLKLVKTNPLIPYSIIISKNDIEKIRKDGLDIFTSYPIPIVERESLNNVVGQSENEVFILNKAIFLLAFNEKLLKEKELQLIINNLENQKVDLEEKIQNKTLEIKKYIDLFYFIKDNPLSKCEYTKLNKNIEENKFNITENEKTLNNAKAEIKVLKEKIEAINQKISSNTDNIKELKREELDFKDFTSKYEEYKDNKEDLSKLENEIESINIYLEKQNNEIKNLTEKIEKLKDERRNLENNLQKSKENLIKYKSYTSGEIINKDIEDLEARFDSLTREISSSLKELELQLEKEYERQKRDEEQLIEAQNNYNLVDSDYQSETYNINTQRIIEQDINEAIKAQKQKNEEEKIIIKQKGRLENQITQLYLKLKEEFEKETPKEKEEVTDKDFEKLIFIQKSNADTLEKNKQVSISNISKINSNLSNLAEFYNLEIKEAILLDIKTEELRDFIGRLKRDYNNSKDEEHKLHTNLNQEIDKVSREKEFIEDDFFKKSLDVIAKVSEKPSEVISNLDQTLKAHKLTLEKLSADIDFINKEKEKVVEILYDYIYEVHINLGKIDKNSTIKIKEKDVKMLTIKTEDWEENKDLYKLKTKNILESLTNTCLDKLEINENIEETISKTITTKNLYNEVVSIGSIDVKLYKVEENRQRMISWEQVCQNSGGEGFLSAFIVLNSLLSFMRKNDSDIFKNYQDSKVIIMDNPFAQTNAEHLLKPLMDIAKKSNTQLICFSGLKGDSIYNRFDNIYVIDLVNSKLKNNLSFLKGNHYKGEDMVQEIISSRFEIKEEVIDQMTLF
ncbi:hypothetical protein [Romboutsia sp.]|uniref:hypothetical protein n=1 Tax=Romboutsia sp. TaxID=1965302 RepID=UPI003F35AA9A